MEKKKYSAAVWAKFLIMSAIGIFMFFVNITIGGKTAVPMVQIINFLKAHIPAAANQWMVVLLCLSTVVTGLWAKSSKAPAWIKEHHANDGLFDWFTFITASIFSVMVIFNVGPEFVINPAIGMSSLNITRDVMYSVIIAGGLVGFLTEFGLLDCLGVILEPIMRKLFRVPGEASIDALSSFVSAPSVGVMITNGLYKNKTYTQREAVTITTCFSVCSLGTYVFLSGMANCSEYYSQLVLSSLLLCFVMAAIMVRIAPTSRKKDIYIDGTVQTPEQRQSVKYSRQTLPNAVTAGLEKAGPASFKCIPDSIVAAVGFAQKVAAYIMSLSIIFLALANYTPVVGWLGAPVAPILRLLGLADVELIAPSILSGFLALSLPATLLKGTAVCAASGFFVVLVSTAQVIFFTESANAMLQSEIPVDFKDLLIIFLERTIILMPLAALIVHIIF